MLKRLAIIGVLFVVTQAPMPATGKTPNNFTYEGDTPKSATQQGKNIPTPLSPEGNGQNHKSDPGKSTDDDQQVAINITNPASVSIPWGLREWGTWAANIALAIVGIFGICIAIKTLGAIRSQTKAAMISARSSLKQANHLIASDRGWLVISSYPEEPSPVSPMRLIRPSFRWVIQNKGRTPCRLIETQCKYEILLLEDLFNLPEKPIYPPRAIELKKFVLVPDAQRDYSTHLLRPPDPKPVTNLDNSDGYAIKIGSFNLRAYGYVKYLDVFGIERESRFCEYFVYRKVDAGVEFGFEPMLGIPAAYTEHT